MSQPKKKAPSEQKLARSYNSAFRRKQAEETRRRIADAAEELIRGHGYENTTIEAIAGKAGVAPQTVYAVFHSKQGILLHLLKRSMRNAEMDSDYQSLIRRPSLEEAAEGLAALTARQARMNFSAINTLGGMEVLYPELADLAREAHEFRRAHILEGVREGMAVRGLKSSPEQEKMLADIFWAFTDMHLYYMLVAQSGWTDEDYESIMKKVLVLLMREVAPEMLKRL
ncbi:MAG: TetR/AcrR family transcriptional regulator [Desulfovibrionaceae bacterium]|nr:TetR/AcrR family transcriptional regulator [Desulfovibrionaceae bacterium]